MFVEAAQNSSHTCGQDRSRFYLPAEQLRAYSDRDSPLPSEKALASADWSLSQVAFGRPLKSGIDHSVCNRNVLCSWNRPIDIRLDLHTAGSVVVESLFPSVEFLHSPIP